MRCRSSRLKVDDPIEEVEEERPAVKRQKRKASAGDEELVEETTGACCNASASLPRGVLYPRARWNCAGGEQFVMMAMRGVGTV